MGSIAPVFGSIVPSQKQQTLQNNYLSFNTGGANDFIQQYLPEIYEQEVERYGNRTLSGFLRMVGVVRMYLTFQLTLELSKMLSLKMILSLL